MSLEIFGDNGRPPKKTNAERSSKLRAAAERVMRLSKPGTATRFFTLSEVSHSTGLSPTAIVKEIGRLKGSGGSER